MKALCITGADNITLEAIAAPFYKAGMTQPKTLVREQEINFSIWHQQVKNALDKQLPIGNLWESLAIDLLLANLDSDLWGWYEERSVKALSFWGDLEPNIHFLLVCTRPEDELCQKISMAEGPVDTEALIQDWYQRHHIMLQFYLQHPKRCLLIDSQDALQHLNKQLLLAHDHWQLPLDKKKAGESDTSEETLPLSDQPNAIVALVAREALKQTNIDITDLYTELRAAQYPLTGLEESEATTRKLFDWLKKGIDLTSLNQLLVEFQNLQQKADLASKIPLLEDRTQHTQQQLESLKQENELLLLQLHQVQEELENTVLSKQQLVEAKQQLEDTNQKLENNNVQLANQKKSVETLLATAKAEPKFDPKIQQQLKDSQQQNELLLLQLHQVQEELENTFLSKQQIEQAKQQLEETNQKLENNNVQLANQKKSVETLLATAKAEPKFDPKIQQQLKDSQHQNELLLLQLHKVQEELEHFFMSNQELLQQQVLTTNENREIKRQLKQQEAINQQLGQNWFARWIKPKASALIIDYDEVQLRHEQVNKDYEHLWITLIKPSFGQDSVSQWSFRLSCAAIKPDGFGKQPKLELPQQTEQLLHQWFEESSSDYGAKLELRFALPSSVDKKIWQQVALHDKQLISALIRQLPDILQALQEKGIKLSRDWSDWQNMVSDMNRIHQAKLAR